MNAAAVSTNPDLSSIAGWFRRFADAECREEPLYRALCEAALCEPQVLGLLLAAEPEQRRPNLLLAAVQYLLLAGVPHALASYYPSVGGDRGVDEALHPAFVDFCNAHRSALGELIATHTTQTNEVGRCAVLWPVLQLAAKRQGFDRVALLDFGASAGLNLGVDRFAYDYGALRLMPGGPQAVVRLQCRLVGDAGPQASDEDAPRIVSRVGVDTHPVDVFDENSVRWLRACIWPSDTLRAERFDAAVGLAREAPWRVEEHSDCTSAVERWARQVPSDVLPVVFNSWVLTYFAREARARHIDRMHQCVQQRGMVWISAEAPDIQIDESVTPPPVELAHADWGAGTLWTLMTSGNGRPSSQFVVRSHPHGKWMQWLA